MNNHNDNDDRALDRITDEIRTNQLDDAVINEATERVWTNITASVTPLSSCDDYQALIPAFVDGSLPEAKSLLVNDHTRECLPCRRALLEARSDDAGTTVATTRQASRRLPRWIQMAAAAIIAVATSVVGYGVIADALANQQLAASVAEVDGVLQRFGNDQSSMVSQGTVIRASQRIKTARNSSALITLADGSTVEMDERAEISLRGSRRGTTIQLQRGNIIVHAATQKKGRLFVATDDCTVAVKGTVFSVNHGLKGSRVSVVEGEVEVNHGATHALLHPGDQITTNERLASVTVEEEISWSRNADEHLALLRELTTLQRDMVEAADVADARTSTRLLDLAPADTLIYGAMPNLTEGMVKARSVFKQRLNTSPVLADWWQEKIVTSGVEFELDTMLDRLETLGEAVGDEVVLSVPQSAIEGNGAPLILAVLADPSTFQAQLAAEVERINNEAGSGDTLVIVTDLTQTPNDGDQVYLWVSGDIFAATLDFASLVELNSSVTAGSSAFVGSQLHQRLSEAYSGGVEWLFAMNTGEILETAAINDSDPDDLLILEQLGLLDASTLLVERSTDGAVATTQAVLDFDGPRRGMAGWLASPAPMGSLDFISPTAIMAGAVVASDAADMFDELMAAVATVSPDAGQELAELEARLGFDFRNDFVATLGGEAAFAVDGPILPTPAWKLILEVYDPDTLQHTIEQSVIEANAAFETEGQDIRLELTNETWNGREYHAIGLEGQSPVATYTVVDGFLVIAPSVAVIDQALQYRASGLTLPSSQLFTDLLPSNGFIDCSALSFRNLGALASIVPPAALSSLPPGTLDIMEQGSAPSLYCIYGEDDRITLSGTGGSLLGMAPLMSLPTFLEGIGDFDDLADEGVRIETGLSS